MFITRDYECPQHGRFELPVYRSEDRLPQPCPACDHMSAQVFAPTRYSVVPPWMRAPGSNGSSYDFTERQAEYLKSDKHREIRKQDERMAARAEAIESKTRTELKERLKNAS